LCSTLIIFATTIAGGGLSVEKKSGCHDGRGGSDGQKRDWAAWGAKSVPGKRPTSVASGRGIGHRNATISQIE
jgi:hypothetical protein